MSLTTFGTRLKRSMFVIFLLCLLAVDFPTLSASAATDWAPLAPGIDFMKLHLTSPVPNDVFIARMDRNNLDLTLETSIGNGSLYLGPEATSLQSQRYNGVLNFWGKKWGARNRVVVAINGGYTDTTYTQVLDGQAQSGWFAKRFRTCENAPAFAWKSDRTAEIGDFVFNSTLKQKIVVSHSGATRQIDGLNQSRYTDQLILYTPQYDWNTHTNEYGTEVLVEMTRAASLLPANYAAVGYVREVRTNKGSTAIPFDYVVLSGHGLAGNWLKNQLNEGDEIRISQELSNCNFSTQKPDYTNTYASLGGDFFFLRNGAIQYKDEAKWVDHRHPRTAIAYNDNYIFFIVVDGRNPGISEGMTVYELASFTRSLGALWGLAMDGGGSSTMVINGSVVNNTYCNHVDCRPKTAPETTGEIEQDLSGTAPAPTAENIYPDSQFDANTKATLNPDGIIERWVVNGIMMVVVEPKYQVSRYQPGDIIKFGYQTTLHLNPDSESRILTAVPAGGSVIVLEHMNGLNGILARGGFWWKAQYGNIQGWIRLPVDMPIKQFLPGIFR